MAENYEANYWSIVHFVFGIFVVVAILAALAIIPLIMLQSFFGNNKFDVKGKTVLLTGASEGMGKSVAKLLAKKGANVVVASRTVAKLEAALEEVKASRTLQSQRFHYIAVDLAQEGNAADLIAKTITWNGGQAPDVVWCIAGSSYPNLFIDTPLSKMRQQMDVNYWSCADMAHGILKEWLSPASSLKGREKHLIFTSSAAAFVSVAGYAPYSPAKAAIKSLSDALVQEVMLYGDDVKVHTVFPGGISSPGFDNENLTKPGVTHKLEEPDVASILTPDQAAKAAVDGLENGQYLVTLTLLGSAMRACAWGGSARNNWLVDTVMTWGVGMAWPFITRDIDGKVKKYAKEHGHPSTYPKKD